MLRIDRTGKKLVRLTKSTFVDADHWERDLQAMICTDPDSFCEEMGENLWVIGQEVRPSDAVPDRIDILATDEDGTTVVIELKRGTHKLQLLQAISYAGMISKWPSDRFVQTLATNYKQSYDDARAEIEEHIGSDVSAINQDQRIILVAEDFDPALLIGAEWLHEIFEVDIRCYRLSLSQEGGNDYLTCTCVYPPIEIAALTRGSERTARSSASWKDWDEALKAIENPAVADFIRAALASNQETRLYRRQVMYRMGGKRRLWVTCRPAFGYVWQLGRFDGDEQFWKTRLSTPNVKEVNDKRGLRFYLRTAADFDAFDRAVSLDLVSTEFSEPDELDVKGP
ncbi:hypothetical protein ABIE85_005130 [Bradyrhizobium diazoefficiens]|jgi:hypothetical protein|uniref:hypothetical protein n=1 Tax=Bradyrhizobium TaxID=374 RepID=UPI00272B3AB6|nr:hypothetical protein [Bradyrhizobium diazoefficiens]WLA55744.1 hypothetical protein QIH81_35290 [Bradyrhizobium diazoefficiens]